MDPCTIIKMDITKEACLDMIDELQSARYIKDPEKQALLCWKIHVFDAYKCVRQVSWKAHSS